MGSKYISAFWRLFKTFYLFKGLFIISPLKSVQSHYFWVRLNYATTHHHPPPAKICPAPPTTIHHHQPLAKICLSPPTTSQNISTTAYHFIKNGPPPCKSQNIFIITSFRHCFNSSFFFEMQYSFPWRRFCVKKFWSVRFSNFKFLLHSVHFILFKIF